MATCAECVHVDVCRFTDLPAPLSDSYIRESEYIEKRCGNFKNRSRFVELPCKVGDTVYVIKSIAEEEKIIQDHVETLGIGYYADGINIYQWDGVKTDGYFEDFGKTVFLTREEAERALKEREKNAN